MKPDKGLIRFLSYPATFGLKNRTVNVVQTHASYIFIAGNYVYKLKKPVDFGFLDFSTLGKRKYYCEQEVSLNSRLSNSYIGVIPVSYYNRGYRLNDSTNIIDYLVKMKRIPEKYFMKNILAGGRITKKDINRVARKLYKFYTTQIQSNKMIRYGRPRDIKNTLKQNRELGKRFIGKTISKTAFESIKYFNDSFIKVNEKLLEERVEQGCIKDCHGDLHLEHIIIRPDEIEIFDCIEFNDSFRFIDYVCDIAFLSMDLDYHGSFELSNYFVKNMLAKMQDENARRLVDFYKSYRAYVRGKVGSIRSEDKNIPVNERKKSRQNAKKYFQLSLRYSLFGSDPVVIVVFGLIASGKSTLAAILSKELGCNVISSDVTRKQLAGVPLTKRVSKGLYKGLYSKQMTIKTYTEMYRQAQDELSNNNIVILDASFSQQKYRDLVVDKSNKWNSNIIFIETKASDRVIRQRLLDREKKKSISDARIDLFKRFKHSFEPAGKNLKDVYFKTITKDYPDTDRNIRLLFRDIINRNLTTCDI